MTKKEQFISVLEKQIDQLNQKDFDLEAWKKGVVIRLQNTYDQNDQKITQIKDLKIDYSSWALRDSSASYKPEESCKKMGKAILEAIIDEINIFGLPSQKSFNKIYEIIQEDKRDLLKSFIEDPERSGYKKFLQTLDKKTLSELVVHLTK